MNKLSKIITETIEDAKKNNQDVTEALRKSMLTYFNEKYKYMSVKEFEEWLNK